MILDGFLQMRRWKNPERCVFGFERKNAGCREAAGSSAATIQMVLLPKMQTQGNAKTIKPQSTPAGLPRIRDVGFGKKKEMRTRGGLPLSVPKPPEGMLPFTISYHRFTNPVLPINLIRAPGPGAAKWSFTIPRLCRSIPRNKAHAKFPNP